VLARGYALAFDEQGRLVRTAAAVSPGAGLRIVLGEGALRCRVEGIEPGEPERRDQPDGAPGRA
jgi:exonuclease VII large subunit